MAVMSIDRQIKRRLEVSQLVQFHDVGLGIVDREAATTQVASGPAVKTTFFEP